jgi:malate dehydrogenase
MVKVTITGAAGRIAYSLIPLLLHGHIFGPTTFIDLVLLDIPDALQKLQGIALEIDDSNYSLLNSVMITVDAEEAFVNTEVAILLGGYPRLPGMERRDLIRKNAECIQQQARALNTQASRNCKIVIVANPANTNCLVAIKNAPNIPSENFTCLTRLDEERLRGLLLKKLQEISNSSGSSTHHGADIHNVYILGNHSNTQVAYIDAAIVSTDTEKVYNLSSYVSSEEYEELLHRVQHRGAEILKYLQVSSALSAAEATAKHLKDWLTLPSTHNRATNTTAFSMGILIQQQEYGLANDIVYSLPCMHAPLHACKYQIIPNLEFSTLTQELMRASEKELLEERSQIEDYLV